MAILQLIGGAGMFANGGAWQDILNAVVGIGAGACLLFGAIKYHQTATLVYLVLDMIAIILVGVAMAVIIIGSATATASVTASVSGHPDLQNNQDAQDALQNLATGLAIAGIVLFAIVYAIFALFYIYFWVCVFSFYKGLKSGEITSPA